MDLLHVHRIANLKSLIGLYYLTDGRFRESTLAIGFGQASAKGCLSTGIGTATNYLKALIEPRVVVRGGSLGVRVSHDPPSP
jgi:hypothetical protein